LSFTFEFMIHELVDWEITYFYSEVTNAATLTCPYHGWTYDHEGRCVPLHKTFRLLCAEQGVTFVGCWGNKPNHALAHTLPLPRSFHMGAYV